METNKNNDQKATGNNNERETPFILDPVIHCPNEFNKKCF
jgi:hydroxyethylthiazole kinase-like sugar kinase family protein